MAPKLTKRHVTYGLQVGDYRGEIVEARPDGTRFRIRVRGTDRGEARIRMPGVHYAENALAALCVSDFLGVSFADYCEALAAFEGVDRRFTVRGEAGGVLVVDDYCHHPTDLPPPGPAARPSSPRPPLAFPPPPDART